jgi:predicted MFS family arabinose efflux permease
MAMTSRRDAHPALLILILGVAPAVGFGFCRFAYALVLPDMRESVHWSYSTAGFMNTLNLAGYLAGSLGATAVIRRTGMFRSVWIGALACVACLALSATVANDVVFGATRVVSGLATGIAFVAGAALAMNIAHATRERAAFYLSLYYIGASLGIIVSGLVVPQLLAARGAGSWRFAWAVLAAVAAGAVALLPLARRADTALPAAASSARIRVAPIAPYLAGYFLFGAGYIVYMTFMFAYVRAHDDSPFAQSAFWTLIGVGALVQPWVWRAVMARVRSDRGTALLTSIATAGAVLPLLATAPAVFAISAFVFGNTFMAVVASTAAFARANFSRESWPAATASINAAHGLGLIVGPVATGAITDATGSIDTALLVGVGVLALAAITTLFQRSLVIA